MPPAPVSTEQARAALPDAVPMSEASYNIAHATLLTLGLARSTSR